MRGRKCDHRAILRYISFILARIAPIGPNKKRESTQRHAPIKTDLGLWPRFTSLLSRQSFGNNSKCSKETLSIRFLPRRPAELTKPTNQPRARSKRFNARIEACAFTTIENSGMSALRATPQVESARARPAHFALASSLSPSSIRPFRTRNVRRLHNRKIR